MTAEKRPGGRSFISWPVEKRGGGRMFHPIGAEEPIDYSATEDNFDDIADELEPFEPYAKRPGGRMFAPPADLDSYWAIEGGRAKRPGGRAFFGLNNDWGHYGGYRRRMWKRPGGRRFSGYGEIDRAKRPGGRYFGGDFKRYGGPRRYQQWW